MLFLVSPPPQPKSFFHDDHLIFQMKVKVYNNDNVQQYAKIDQFQKAASKS